ncbi:Os01g0507150 [Oryza sativa Japonica Group]|uniref:Os01g0507150 protein n=1 Tax=Oryza sativa subsp. japonica TaxID=39947 RepID=A0A0P0V341_ORYSJ|nr:Os01g0507150 [Oryza sativa Japonica Group]
MKHGYHSSSLEDESEDEDEELDKEHMVAVVEPPKKKRPSQAEAQADEIKRLQNELRDATDRVEIRDGALRRMMEESIQKARQVVLRLGLDIPLIPNAATSFADTVGHYVLKFSHLADVLSRLPPSKRRERKRAQFVAKRMLVASRAHRCSPPPPSPLLEESDATACGEVAEAD